MQANIEALAAEYEEAREAEKAAKKVADDLGKALLAAAKAQNAFTVGEDGKKRLITEAQNYTLTTRVTESLIDAFNAYRIKKVIPLRLLASVITFDKAKVANAVREGRMTEDMLAAIRDGEPKVSEYLTPGRSAK